jgi:hypothetical protein
LTIAAPSEVACDGGSELFGTKGSLGRATETFWATAVATTDAAKAIEEAFMLTFGYSS